MDSTDIVNNELFKTAWNINDVAGTDSDIVNNELFKTA